MIALWFVPILAATSIAICSLVVTTEDSPQGRDEHFTSSEQCAVCHTPAPGATAMLSETGADISPYGLWQGTMMANAFRDPFFRAQLRKETVFAGEEVQELCLRCHTPMLHHEARLAGDRLPRLADVDGDIFADDSVSCTVCHMIDSKGLGDPATWSGRPNFNDERLIFGPFADLATRPMRNLVGYTPTQATHIRDAALCATCHTLHTEHHGTAFPEQTPYLEWRNSEFNDENGVTETSRTCQQCHMPEIGETRLARNPMGFDFNIPVRKGSRGHAFVGGNAFMIDILRENAEDLDVIAEPELMALTAAATRKQLAERTARVTISEIERGQGTASFSVTVENLTGHKFPSGYPSRRAWLQVQVLSGRSMLFESGGYDEETGRLANVADAMNIPHVQTVTRPEDVVVYEMIAADPEGLSTTFLTKMVRRKKDNRLLPRGWKTDGPHLEDIAPIGTDGDADFVGGSDTVHFVIPLPERETGGLRVIARLHYQPVPPAWVDALREVDAEECERFVRYYDAADKTADIVAADVLVEG